MIIMQIDDLSTKEKECLTAPTKDGGANHDRYGKITAGRSGDPTLEEARRSN